MALRKKLGASLAKVIGSSSEVASLPTLRIGDTAIHISRGVPQSQIDEVSSFVTDMYERYPHSAARTRQINLAAGARDDELTQGYAVLHPHHEMRNALERSEAAGTVRVQAGQPETMRTLAHEMGHQALYGAQVQPNVFGHALHSGAAQTSMPAELADRLRLAIDPNAALPGARAQHPIGSIRSEQGLRLSDDTPARELARQGKYAAGQDYPEAGGLGYLRGPANPDNPGAVTDFDVSSSQVAGIRKNSYAGLNPHETWAVGAEIDDSLGRALWQSTEDIISRGYQLPYTTTGASSALAARRMAGPAHAIAPPSGIVVDGFAPRQAPQFASVPGSMAGKPSVGASEGFGGAGSYDDLYSLMERAPVHTAGIARVARASGPRGLADPRLANLGEVNFSTNVIDDQISIIAHRGTANLDDIDHEDALGYIRGTASASKGGYADFTQVFDDAQGHGLGAALLEKFGIISREQGAQFFDADIYGPEMFSNLTNTFGEGATMSLETGKAIKFGDEFAKDDLGSYGKTRTQLKSPQRQQALSQPSPALPKRRTSTARRVASSPTPDKFVGYW